MVKKKLEEQDAFEPAELIPDRLNPAFIRLLTVLAGDHGLSLHTKREIAAIQADLEA